MGGCSQEPQVVSLLQWREINPDRALTFFRISPELSRSSCGVSHIPRLWKEIPKFSWLWSLRCFSSWNPSTRLCPSRGFGFFGKLGANPSVRLCLSTGFGLFPWKTESRPLNEALSFHRIWFLWKTRSKPFSQALPFHRVWVFSV